MITQLSPSQQQHVEYWTAFHKVLKTFGSPISVDRKPQPAATMDYAVGRGNSKEYRLLARRRTHAHPIQAELCLKGPNAKSNFQRLKCKKKAIKKDLGFPLKWEKRPDHDQSHIIACPGKADLSDWPRQHKWLAERLNKMHTVFIFHINKLVRERPHPQPDGWHTGPESETHKCLKRKIAGDPAMVGVKTAENGEEEYLLWSGDKVDVYFAKAAVAVEVKTADAGFSEIHRGIFQCIKYRAVLQAQHQVYGPDGPTADCLLALEGELSEELQDIAKLLNVLVVSC